MSACPPSGIVTLFTVQFRHAYYNLLDGRCPDFEVVATSDCAALIRRLGIMTQVQGDGFRVCAPQSRIPAITDAIFNGDRAGSTGQGRWTRLTYCLTLRNPEFYGITALPLDTSPTRRNLYASNLQTTTVHGELLFGGRAGLGAKSLHPITGATLSFQTDTDAVVTASDISGQPVRSATATAGVPASLSLSGLPNDLYTIASIPDSAYAGPPTVVYVPSRPLSAGIIDLLLTQPAAGMGNPAAFPISGPSTSPPSDLPADAGSVTPTVRTVGLVLSFAARKTTWKYFIVSLNRSRRFASDLTITGEGATFKQASAPVALPNGEEATLFQSTTTLSLRQQSPYRFALSGQSQGVDGSRDRISVDPLPGAAGSPVWPAATGNGMSGSSEIFVYV